MEGKCIFCQLAEERKNFIEENELAYAVWDIKPITKGHALVITKRHFENLASTEDEDLFEVFKLVKRVVKKLKELYPDIQGFRYMSNQGVAAKQVVFHLHIHIIPKY